MVEKTIRLLATLRDLAGGREITVQMEDEATVRDLIEAIQKASPQIGQKILDDQGDLTGLVHIFVNGRSVVWLEGLDTRVGPADTLLLVPPIAGG